MSKASRLMLVFFIWNVAWFVRTDPPTDTLSAVYTLALALLCGICGSLFIMLGDDDKKDETQG